MVKPNVLITGSNGLVGKAFKEYLFNKGDTCIVGIDLTGDYLIDIRSMDELERIFKIHKFDSIVHLAGLKDINESFKIPDEYYRTNVEGTKNLLALADKYEVPQFIFASSGSVAFSDNPYSNSKADAEDLVVNRGYGAGINCRLDSVLQTYGSTYYANATSLIDNMLRTLHGDREVFELYGNTLRHFITLDMVSDKFHELIHSQVPSHTTTFDDVGISIKTLDAMNMFMQAVGNIKVSVKKQREWEISLPGEAKNINMFKDALIQISKMKYALGKYK